MKKILLGVFCSVSLFICNAFAGANADTLDWLDSTAFVRRDDPKVIYVAKGGFGTYSTISSAMNSLPTPNTTPTVIKIMPGTYTEGVTLKSNVHLQGVGRDKSVIQGAVKMSSPSVENIIVSGLSIKYLSYISGFNAGIDISSGTNVAIKGNYLTSTITQGMCILSSSTTIDGNVLENISHRGINIASSSSALIRNNVIKNTGDYPISSDSSSTSIMTDNVVEGGGDCLLISSSGSRVVNNIIKDGGYRGVCVSASGAVVKGNIITGHSAGDINVLGGASPNVSHNIYDTFTGTGAVGLYNVKSDGTPAPIQ